MVVCSIVFVLLQSMPYCPTFSDWPWTHQATGYFRILMSGPQSIYLFIWMIDWFFYLVFLWSQSLTLENWPFLDNCWWMLEPGRDMVSKVQQCTIDKISKLHFPTRQYSSLNVIAGLLDSLKIYNLTAIGIIP